MASKQGKSAEPQYTDFQPNFEWKEDPAKHVLQLQLPGFRKEEFNVQLDSSGKLTVKGKRPLGGDKFARFHNVFQIPADSNVDNISGRLERSCLSLTFPKKVVQKEEKPQEKVESREEKEEPKRDDKVESPEEKGKPKSSEEEEEDSTRKEKPRSQKTKEATPSVEAEQKTDEKREEYRMPGHTVGEPKPSAAGHDGKVKVMRKKVVAWKEKISKDVEELWDSGLMDNVMEKIDKNKVIIAVTVTSISIGLIVFHRMRSSGK
ncbi:uncharacterized protein [Typha angustifolia]|uniref:uncharacterized protein n=1 Tax=Typha angustifolia TaxID=59011 RepID=UPI003C2E9481